MSVLVSAVYQCCLYWSVLSVLVSAVWSVQLLATRSVCADSGHPIWSLQSCLVIAVSSVLSGLCRLVTRQCSLVSVVWLVLSGQCRLVSGQYNLVSVVWLVLSGLCRLVSRQYSLVSVVWSV